MSDLQGAALSSGIDTASSLLLRPMERMARRRRSFVRRYPTLVAGAALLLLVIAAAIFGPMLSPYDPTGVDVLNPLAPPLTGNHLLGTDSFGRDILSRILSGGRIDLAIGFGATAVTVTIGSLIG